MTESLQRHFADEAALADFAAQLAPCVRGGGVIHLHGELGAGKTSLARALIRALGVDARIKSPTYSLIESYRVPGLAIHHLDLYRIADPGELEWLGLDELQSEPSLTLVEWPERGGERLPRADLRLLLGYAEPGRSLSASASGATGANWLRALAAGTTHANSAG